MPIQRSNSRRRRVFLEESVVSDQSESAVSENTASNLNRSKSAKIYADAAKRDGQLKITDLIPKNHCVLGSIIAGCCLVILLLNFLEFSAPSWSEVLSGDAIETLSFSGVGTVSSWFSSFLLLMTAMASLLIYSMRRHRNDDYSGAYRVWLWLALLFVVASVNSVVDFRSVLHSLAQSAGYPLNQNLLLLLGFKFFALNIIVIRGVFEIKQSRGATIAVVIAWVGYAAALAAQLPIEQSNMTQHKDIILGNSILVGTVSCFSMSLIFARFIYLHANELIAVQPASKAIAQKKNRKKVESEKKPKTNSDQDSQETPTDSATKISKQTDKKKQVTKPKLADLASDSSTNDDELETLSMKDSQELSKSQRRRLRKLQKRQRRAA